MQNRKSDRRLALAGEMSRTGCRSLPEWISRGEVVKFWLNRGTAEAEQRRLAKMFLKRFRLKGLAHESAELVRMTGEELKTRSASGAAVVDVRLGIQFAEGHFPGSLNVGLGGRMFRCLCRPVPAEAESDCAGGG